MPASASIKTTKKQEVQSSLRTCFDGLLTKDRAAPYPLETLINAGWQRHSGTNLARLRRRTAINRLGEGTAIGTRSGYRDVLRYYRRIKIRQKVRLPDFTRHVSGALSVRSHVMTHHDWPDALVIAAETNREEERSTGHSVGLWAFVPSDIELLDPKVAQQTFDGTADHFHTPKGTWRGKSHQWINEDNGKSLYGWFRYGGRDSSSTEFYRQRFVPKLLPDLTLPDACVLYHFASSSRYY